MSVRISGPYMKWHSFTPTMLCPSFAILLPFFFMQFMQSTLSDFFFWRGDLNTVFLIPNFNSDFFVTWIQM